jgi:hypothetical protein
MRFMTTPLSRFAKRRRVFETNLQQIAMLMYGPSVLIGLGGFKRNSLVADRALRKNIFPAHRTRVRVECSSAFVEVAAHPDSPQAGKIVLHE